MAKYNTSPNYHLIFEDILKIHSKKRKLCQKILDKASLSCLDVIDLNQIIYETPNKDVVNFNQKYRSYSKSDILYLLDYQKKHGLNNTQLANHFKLSRNTVSKWKKFFKKNGQ